MKARQLRTGTWKDRSLSYEWAEYQLESREALHTHFKRKNHLLLWGLTRPQLMHINQKSYLVQSIKALWKAPCPRAHEAAHPQAVRALASYLAAGPPAALRSCQLYTCLLSPAASQSRTLQRSHSACSRKATRSLTWGTNTRTMTSNRAELAGARTRAVVILSHGIYLHAHLEWWVSLAEMEEWPLLVMYLLSITAGSLREVSARWQLANVLQASSHLRWYLRYRSRNETSLSFHW